MIGRESNQRIVNQQPIAPSTQARNTVYNGLPSGQLAIPMPTTNSHFPTPQQRKNPPLPTLPRNSNNRPPSSNITRPLPRGNSSQQSTRRILNSNGNLVLQDWRSSNNNGPSTNNDFERNAIRLDNILNFALPDRSRDDSPDLARINQRMHEYSFLSSDEDNREERKFQGNYQRDVLDDSSDLDPVQRAHLERILQPRQRFQADQNAQFRDMTRAQRLRQESTRNTLEERKQQERRSVIRSFGGQAAANRRGQGRLQVDPNANNDQIIADILNFPTRRLEEGLQNLRDRLDIYDNLLNEIEQFQDETQEIVRNMQQIEHLVVRNPGAKEEKKGLSEDGLAKQKKVICQKTEETCSICIINFEIREEVYELVCGHKFHQGCIEPWFKQSCVCPNCRKDLN